MAVIKISDVKESLPPLIKITNGKSVTQVKVSQLSKIYK